MTSTGSQPRHVLERRARGERRSGLHRRIGPRRLRDEEVEVERRFLVERRERQRIVMDERERIVAAYHARETRSGQRPPFFAFEDPAHVTRVLERLWATLQLLHRHGFHPLRDRAILDVGCGDGNLLRQLVQCGARPELLAGIDLRSDAVELASRLGPAMDLRCGTAAELPWPDETFALVCQHTMFTSILDDATRRRAAAEMTRVLRDDGAILWYDFIYNPGNPDVRGIGKREIRGLFCGLDIQLHRITLATPITRLIPQSLLPVVHPLLAAMPWLRSHYLGLFLKARR